MWLHSAAVEADLLARTPLGQSHAISDTQAIRGSKVWTTSEAVQWDRRSNSVVGILRRHRTNHSAHIELVTVQQILLLTKTLQSHLTTAQVMMPSPHAAEHDISVRTRPAESNARCFNAINKLLPWITMCVPPSRPLTRHTQDSQRTDTHKLARYVHSATAYPVSFILEDGENKKTMTRSNPVIASSYP